MGGVAEGRGTVQQQMEPSVTVKLQERFLIKTDSSVHQKDVHEAE